MKSSIEGLADVVVRLLQSRIGEENRISRSRLLNEVQQICPDVSDRVLRMAIEFARKSAGDGSRICSTTRGGYYLAKDRDELCRYLAQDWSRVSKLSKRLKSQATAARFSDAQQQQLFT